MALFALALKLVVAARTIGTNDVRHWMEFASVVSQSGPVGVYGASTTELYNHPPLVGFYLQVANLLKDGGIPIRFTIRSVASVADVVSSLVIFELLRRRRSLVVATASGVLVAASPVLFLVSGFHGNNDPVFIMLVLLSTFLLVDRKRAVAGGLVLALALSVKIVPIVVVPALFVYLLRRSGTTFTVRAVAGFSATILLVWGPALVLQRQGLLSDVIGYRGIAVRQWGVYQFAVWSESPALMSWLAGTGATLGVVVAAVVPALLVWQRPDRVVECVGVSLVLLLTLSPAFGVQYLVWALAAVYLVDFWCATVYNVLAGVFLFIIYNDWSGGSLPWNEAFGARFTPGQVVLGVVVWGMLGATLLLNARSLLFPASSSTSEPRPRDAGSGAEHTLSEGYTHV